MTLYKWSQTASANGTADSSCPFPEGMSPAAVNDGARGMMAAISKYRDDIAGAIVTGGTSTAYTVLSFQQFDTLAHLDGKEIAFTPHATNGATVTLSVDGLGNKPLRSSPGTELLAGVLVQGTPYVAVYNNTDGAFYLRGFFGASPYLIPLGGLIDFIGTAAPNSLFAMPFGQAVSRTTYSALFAMVGTTFGAGDGTTTFNLPDLRGRVVAGKGDMGGVDAGLLTAAYFGSITGASGATLGAKGGEESHALTVGEHATLSVTGTITVSPPGGGNVPYSTGSFILASAGGGTGINYVNASGGNVSPTPSLSGVNTLTSTGTGGTKGAPHNNVQPTIVLNKILRII